MADYEEIDSTTGDKRPELTIYLPDADGAPGGTGYITAGDRREMRADPNVAPRLERVQHMVKTGETRFVQVDRLPTAEPLD